MSEKNKFKVVISDLDGTLLNNEHKISPYTKKVFQELHRQNFTLIVATGRHHLDALPVIETIGVPIYLVTSKRSQNTFARKRTSLFI
jgi:HAD superfamily hydrolase (TIGR01484 family)